MLPACSMASCAHPALLYAAAAIEAHLQHILKCHVAAGNLSATFPKGKGVPATCNGRSLVSSGQDTGNCQNSTSNIRSEVLFRQYADASMIAMLDSTAREVDEPGCDAKADAADLRAFFGRSGRWAQQLGVQLRSAVFHLEG